MNILIVDDEKLLRDVVKEYCLNDNYNVYEAENGLEALQVLEKENIDLIVLDIMMPKMDGYTFFKQMKEKENIPTIVLSARGEEYDKLLGFDLGIDDYLTKPFSPRELMARIKAILKRSNNLVEDNIFVYQGIKVDFKGRVLYIDNEFYVIQILESFYVEIIIFPVIFDGQTPMFLSKKWAAVLFRKAAALKRNGDR